MVARVIDRAEGRCYRAVLLRSRSAGVRFFARFFAFAIDSDTRLADENSILLPVACVCGYVWACAHACQIER